jgi:hypothetical protein
MVRGRLEVPDAWRGSDEWKLEVVGDDDFTKGLVEPVDLTGTSRVLELVPVRLAPARYLLRIRQAGWELPLDLGTSGTVVDHRLPEPGEVRIRVETAGSSKAAARTEVSWRKPLPDGDPGHRPFLRSAKRPKDWSFQAAPGAVEVEVSASGWSRRLLKLDVAAGSVTEKTVTLERAGRIEVELAGDPDGFLSVKITPASGGETLWEFASGKDSAVADHLEPGDYIVSTTEDDIEPKERRVTVKAGETTNVKFERKKRDDGGK